MEALQIIGRNVSLEIWPFDMDNELQIRLSQDEVTCMYLSPNQANVIISYLAEQLKSINEPIDFNLKH